MKNLNLFFLLLGSINFANLCTANISQSLDEIALEYLTDKCSLWHNYTAVYEKYFKPLRKDPINLLEIGFYFGNSARAWEKYFPNGQFFYIDIDKNCYNRMHGLTKSKLYMVDQSSPEALNSFMQQLKIEFDIIIDDGSHMVDHMITSFKNLFPFLKKGGIYVIEDLHCAYLKVCGAEGTEQTPIAGPNSAITFLQNLVHEVNYASARLGCGGIDKFDDNIKTSLNSAQAQFVKDKFVWLNSANWKNILANRNYHQEHIESITFYPSMCFIIKK